MTVDSVDKLTVRAALYETSVDGTTFISVSNEGEYGLHFDVGDALADADEAPLLAWRLTSTCQTSNPFERIHIDGALSRCKLVARWCRSSLRMAL